jgi:hypothetical protein
MGTMFSEVVQCIGIHEVSRDLVRFVFNRTEGKLEVEVLMDNRSTAMIPKPFAQIYSIANGQLE